MQETLWQRVKEGLEWFDGAIGEGEEEEEAGRIAGNKGGGRRRGFEQALERYYPKFRVIHRDLLPSALEPSTRRALEVLKDQMGWFRRDYVWVKGKVTQTMVTRLLVGERGCTYKYKGLRLFCRSWETEAAKVPDSACHALAEIRRLNEVLKEKSRKQHECFMARGEGSGEGAVEGGVNSFNATLINYFDESIANHVETRPEPYYGMGRCCISWHADDGVVEQSAIAVYNVIERAEKGEEEELGEVWKVGLKVKWEVDTPGVAVPMVNGDAYVMLSGFNEKNQHCVVCGRGSRFSSTHRVCPQEDMYHNFYCRCRETFLQLHFPWNARGVLQEGEERRACLSKIVASLDALEDLHDQLEFEWLRQFHFQYFDLPPSELDDYWVEVIHVLADLWQRMEIVVWIWISCCRRKSFMVGGKELRDRLERLRQLTSQQKGQGQEVQSSLPFLMKKLLRSEGAGGGREAAGEKAIPEDALELVKATLARRLQKRQEHRIWWEENFRKRLSMGRGGEQREGGKRKRKEGRADGLGFSLLPANLNSLVSTLK
ncbi:hypothetical protein GUITHDRAFT_103165 [Guillardia theta CCMP2712]|uniref:Alpha-ketoglutarate-dependent dioxygenase FTO n=1 Tax=Guillardia theta (strain CCMP2712) TaxID=905079 RepID=L1JT40_GUITC|nr:hypothetical protein GUITHDRAFT_103165 [Guillardia theta CCMP2712]EKX51248.1 hypothetical protein GUITHDRAFT_103165 [Guillardia theta CCMP2712]|eukprot:XP_005838228.1 hypothetical protein GUITHDRAFT_103165 [Guillardia theta CCMP2712]